MSNPSETGLKKEPVVLPEASRRRVVLRAENVQRYFEDGASRRDVLKGASLELHAGTVTALVGRSGSGKSTLLHLLGLLDWPDGGEILADGTPAGSMNECDRACLRNTHIGFVFQHFFLLPEFSVLENVLLPAQIGCPALAWMARKQEMRARAFALLEQVGLEAQARQYPPTLSGGERQRAALARALLLQPKLLLCDEPTGNLDPETGTHIINLLFQLSRKHEAAVLVVTHDRSIADRADRVLRLEQGKLSIEK